MRSSKHLFLNLTKVFKHAISYQQALQVCSTAECVKLEKQINCEKQTAKFSIVMDLASK